MYKSTAQAEQFQARVANESTKGSRKGFLLDAGGESPLAQLTPEEQRTSLVMVLKSLLVQNQTAKATKNEVWRKELARQITDVNNAIHAIRPSRRSAEPLGLAQHFIDVCREQMTKPQFNAVMFEANRRQRLALGLEQPIKLANGQA